MDIYNFFRNVCSPLHSKDITAFLRHPEQCVIPTNCFLFHKFISLSSRNIQVFRKTFAKFKYPAE